VKGRLSATTSPVHAGASPNGAGGSWDSSGSSGFEHILDSEEKRIAQEVVE
jgi:hypothetical protein